MSWAHRSVPFVLALLASALLLFSPPTGLPSGPDGSDKLVHFAIFLVLGLTGSLTRLPRWWLALGLAAYAGVSELVQGALPYAREADWRDAISDLAGLAAALVLAAFARGRTPLRAGSPGEYGQRP